MPTFGVVTSPDHADALRAVGWNFVEGNAVRDLAGDGDGTPAIARAGLPVPACANLLPGDLPVVGESVADDAVDAHLATVLRRAGAAGVDVQVFGSGRSRRVPDGFDRGRARDQIVAFLARAAPVAAEHGVTLVVEPLNRGECNILNTVAESMEVVRAVGRPSVQVLVDSYHLWLEDEPLEHVRDAMPHVRHVHVADRDGRAAPGESGTDGSGDYRPLFATLKAGGYDGGVSVECRGFDPADAVASNRVLTFLRDQWVAA